MTAEQSICHTSNRLGISPIANSLSQNLAYLEAQKPHRRCARPNQRQRLSRQSGTTAGCVGRPKPARRLSGGRFALPTTPQIQAEQSLGRQACSIGFPFPIHRKRNAKRGGKDFLLSRGKPPSKRPLLPPPLPTCFPLSSGIAARHKRKPERDFPLLRPIHPAIASSRLSDERPQPKPTTP